MPNIEEKLVPKFIGNFTDSSVGGQLCSNKDYFVEDL
jgi:hypothetical protein